MMYAIAAGVGAFLILTGALLFQTSRLGALQERYDTVNQELDDAKAQTEALARATREHAQQLAAARRQAADASRVVAAIPKDDCFDRRLPTAALSVLRMHGDEGGKAGVAPAGRRKADPPVSR